MEQKQIQILKWKYSTAYHKRNEYNHNIKYPYYRIHTKELNETDFLWFWFSWVAGRDKNIIFLLIEMCKIIFNVVLSNKSHHNAERA